jgi:anti-sigma B factor antagonist
MPAEVLTLTGEIDLNEKPSVEAKLDPLIEKKSPAIVIDLAEVSYVDSSGLAVFIDALQRTQSYGGKLALANLTEKVRMVFTIARLDQVFDIYPDRETALRKLG